ncbi:Putative protein [Zobellia galactanivorans]|uniref:Uncharacterized protein n=1 Tax=Zobellia galactanivorans (strain DSM 12802 / CCUG 47099 / CIP 106680 / NCIMB 13871 / Dsij) TaxID=63186 RepID=G0L8G1_ZOBGA|nr:Putative protein [Zobellia galactanivorans]
MAFAFRHARSVIFWFCFFFFCSKAKSHPDSYRDCGHHKNTQAFRLSLKPVLFIGCVTCRLFSLTFPLFFYNN